MPTLSACQLALPGVIGLVHAEDGLILARVAGGRGGDPDPGGCTGGTPERMATGRCSRRRWRPAGRLRRGKTLFLEVSVENTAALRLYRKAGCLAQPRTHGRILVRRGRMRWSLRMDLGDRERATLGHVTTRGAAQED